MRVRRRLRLAFNGLRGVAYAGRSRTCSCCDGRFRGFLPTGHPVRPDTMCPNCESRERHRLLAIVVKSRQELHGGRTLHFAPEPALTRVIKPIASEYVTTDLDAEDVDVRADMTELPFEDGRWDLIVAAHVLEHVDGDLQAMRELRRVLSPSGSAILIVPRRAGVPTDEDPSVTDPGERTRRFGQSDHVRIYGDDLEARLRDSGFRNIEPITLDQFAEKDVELYRLRQVNAGSGEATLICR